MKITIQTLGKKLNEARGDRGIREVASEIGVSPATLSRIERGNLPDLETFGKICKWLKIDPGAVLGFEKEAEEEAPIVVHFRKEREISPETAKALANVILAAQRLLISTASGNK